MAPCAGRPRAAERIESIWDLPAQRYSALLAFEGSGRRTCPLKTRGCKTPLADLDDIFAKFGEHYQLTF
jgi:hypothetical protein